MPSSLLASLAGGSPVSSFLDKAAQANDRIAALVDAARSSRQLVVPSQAATLAQRALAKVTAPQLNVTQVDAIHSLAGQLHDTAAALRDSIRSSMHDFRESIQSAGRSREAIRSAISTLLDSIRTDAQSYLSQLKQTSHQIRDHVFAQMA